MDDLLKRLEAIVGTEHLVVGEAAASYAVDGKRAEAAVFPGTAEEVSAVLAACHEARVAVTPWGGGTAIGLGGVPERVQLVLGTRRLNQVLEHEPADMTATLQAGITLQDCQAALGKNGQFLALDPPQGARATLGGLLASNASGPRRQRYGSLRDLVIGLRVAQADGTLVRAGAKVVKNVTGYDMNKLYVGSLGTLGVILEASFRLYPLPAAERTWIGTFPEVGRACQAVARIADSPIVPAAVELLDAPAAVEIMQAGALDVQPGVLLAVAVASVPEAVEHQLRAVSRHGMAAGEAMLGGEAHERFWEAIRDLAVPPRGCVLKAALLPGAVAAAMERGRGLTEPLGLRLRTVAEAGAGVIRYYIDAEAGDPEPERVAGVVQALRRQALESRGSLVVLAAPPEVKGLVDVWGSVGGAFPLMRDLKHAFDPGRILNPGRFVGGL
ncbi:MAG: FAD-binding oxidoreductase [Candidatus Methylomirabilales bacterium]